MPKPEQQPKLNPIPVKEKLSFDDIFHEGNVRPIKWSDEYKKWPHDKQLKYAQGLASAMNEAATAMQSDRDKVFDSLKIAKKLKDEADQSRDIAKNTMTQAIIESNINIQRLEKQVIELTARNAILEKAAN